MSFQAGPAKGTESYTQLDSLLCRGKLAQEEKFDGDASNETMYICYSSGTTGLSKGVEVRIPLISNRLGVCSYPLMLDNAP